MRWASDVTSVAVVACLVGHAGEARADDFPEASYGRIAGDVTVVGALGGVVATRGPRAEAELRLRYLESAGIFVTYEDGTTFASAAEPGRVLTAGAELRPLFLYRWLQGKEEQLPRLDLAVDSLGLELGAVLAQPAGAGFASEGGVQLGLGLEVPLFRTSTGPWIGLHGGVRWSEALLASGDVRSADDRSVFLAISLAWHQVVLTHLVDAGDRAPR
jgi:hypothetical protein